MAPKLCTECGSCEKAPGVHRCEECRLRHLPAAEREKAADIRLDAVPLSMRRQRVPEAAWPDGRRWCSGCQSFVRFSDVSGSRCKTCASRAGHASMLERTYLVGLPDGTLRPFTAADYAVLLEKQGGRCYFCRRRPRSKRLAVDHNHITLKVRGLLCADDERGCNHAILGNIRDLAMARRIVDYLEVPPAERWLLT